MNNLTLALDELNKAVSIFHKHTTTLKEIVTNFHCNSFCERCKNPRNEKKINYMWAIRK